MRRLSIKSRITLWYAALLLIICAVTVWTLAAAGEYALNVYCEETFLSAAHVIQDELEIEHGRLEIDEDIDDVPNVYGVLLEDDGSLIYGRRRVNAPFEEGAVRRIQQGDHSWYVYDVHLSVPDWESVWLRLHMSADVLEGMYHSLADYSRWIVPVLALLALAGGWLITKRAMHPVQRISKVAASIAGGGDLSARVKVKDGAEGDELHALGTTINSMLERLEYAFEREQRFTSDAAHELRTPLNALMTQGEFALSRSEEQEKDEAILRMLEKAEEMNTLINQLLMLARLESGQMQTKESCPLDEMIGQIAEDLAPVAQERGMEIAVQPLPCTIQGNRSMLMRAIINLVDNAIRYGREDGTILIQMEKTDREISIAVQDDGNGLCPEEMEKAFMRFWRADSSRSTAGTGVGLSIVQSVAKAHGGSAEVTSVPGEGARFTIRIPI